ncbi:hypothetical protein MLD38_019368 [Melastoma candidum]|uniref:Uncharacterized protein n=1 Tax=Melastoma candidum TaxID=119954 RepID=A0ACB9QX06_9MYRT|nr:hypothetical protein MLD38_019368 [Melastoma candidum]
MKGVLNKLCFDDKLVIGNQILMDLHNYNCNGDSSLQLNYRSLTITTLADRYSLGWIARALEIASNVEKLVIDFTPKTSYAVCSHNT